MKILNFLKEIIKLFINSCGLALIIIFFSYEGIEGKYTIQDIQKLVWNIFCLSGIVLYGFRLIKFQTSENKEVKLKVNDAMSYLSENSEYDVYREYNQKVSAVHEAGHAIMAYIQGVEKFKVEMLEGNPRLIWLDKLQDADGIKRKILIDYSGAISEELTFGFFHEGSLNGEKSDFYLAREHIKSYIVMTDHNVSKALLDQELAEKIILLSKEFWQEVKAILVKNKKLIEILSAKLLEKKNLSDKEVKDLLDAAIKLD